MTATVQAQGCGGRRGASPSSPARALLKAVLACVLLAIALSPLSLRAHDVPGEMRMHVFVKPEGDRLHLLVRMPLALLLNIDLPKRGPGYLALSEIDAGIARAVAATDRGIVLTANDRRLAMAEGRGRISLPSDRSFDSYERALALLDGPRLPDSTYVFWNQGYFDAHLVYPIDAAQSTFEARFGIAPGLRDRLKIDLRYISRSGTVRAYDLATGGDAVALDPSWLQAASTFVRSGFAHILDGPDHLLFLFCLVIPLRRLDWTLAGVVTAFTVGHSVTLISAAYGLTPAGGWFAPLIEFLIAASILYMALENAVRPSLRHRWALSAIFGLVHGFGFSFLLQSQLQFAGSHLLLSLLAFNVGIEFGQLLVLALALPLLVLLYRSGLAPERVITLTLSVLIGHTALHWAGERFEALRDADADGAAAMLLVPALALGIALALPMRAARRRRETQARGDGSTPRAGGVQAASAASPAPPVTHASTSCDP
ncbi:HupE/UreJ family protein [Noviherbaspirillum aridicola]|uniref:HupE/UreJ protein n=1 Tax=Noviherbaspirillum aridicola TaxID=2849687 RepID=A0ABQ4Q0K5_9BURK|nr:HupE/UreJ family protein [Noviherbaspirillum aridicola]GIZ50284.1 hypothetical protein NCCP691_02980 [Noviherbaspirillum aridicola]